MKIFQHIRDYYCLPLARQFEQKNIAIQILKINFIFSAINALYLCITNAFGTIITPTYLFTGDLFADYFKYIFSFPGALPIKIHHGGIWRVLRTYLSDNPHHGVEGLTAFLPTHFHLPPLSSLFCILNRQAMSYVNPVILYCLLLALLFLLLLVVGKETGGNKKSAFVWTACIVTSYPLLFTLQRGNLHAMATALLITMAILLFYKRKHVWLALTMLAIAVNIRPNAVLFIAAFLMTRDAKWLPKLLFFGTVSVAIFFACLLPAHFLYPDYTLPNFLRGLNIYHYYSAIENFGQQFNASLFGLLRTVVGYRSSFEPIGLAVGGVVAVGGVGLYYAKSISASVFAFFLCSAYALASSIFADYHLTVFFAPLLLMSLENGGRVPSLAFSNRSAAIPAIVFIACNLVLCPKTYFTFHRVSALDRLNPLIMLTGVILIAYAAVSTSGRRATSCIPDTVGN